MGARIRAARAERGWTQDALAEAVGVSRSAVAQWETDRAGQVRDTLPRIAAALGVSVEYLLTGDDKHAPREASDRRRARAAAPLPRMRPGGPRVPAPDRAQAGADRREK